MSEYILPTSCLQTWTRVIANFRHIYGKSIQTSNNVDHFRTYITLSHVAMCLLKNKDGAIDQRQMTQNSTMRFKAHVFLNNMQTHQTYNLPVNEREVPNCRALAPLVRQGLIEDVKHIVTEINGVANMPKSQKLERRSGVCRVKRSILGVRSERTNERSNASTIYKTTNENTKFQLGSIVVIPVQAGCPGFCEPTIAVVYGWHDRCEDLHLASKYKKMDNMNEMEFQPHYKLLVHKTDTDCAPTAYVCGDLLMLYPKLKNYIKLVKIENALLGNYFVCRKYESITNEEGSKILILESFESLGVLKQLYDADTKSIEGEETKM